MAIETSKVQAQDESKVFGNASRNNRSISTSHRWLITGLLKESKLWTCVQPTLNVRKKTKSKSPSQVKL